MESRSRYSMEAGTMPVRAMRLGTAATALRVSGNSASKSWPSVGSGTVRSVISVMTPSVPSEPMSSGSRL